MGGWKCCVATSDQVLPTPLGTKEWLQASPRGAYTAARTVHSTSIMQLGFHIRRLSQTVQLMMEADGQAAGQPSRSTNMSLHSGLLQPDVLRPDVIDSMRRGIRGFQDINQDYKGEMRVTVLITWDQASHTLSTHVSPLPTTFKSPVKVLVNGAPRENAEAKDSEWCRQRAELEASQPADVNEVLLANGDGGVMEGLTSNFFVVHKSGRVETAGDGVLAGTVRDIVLQVCEREGIPVALRPPQLSEASSWQDAFITSTSRLVLPVDELAAAPGAQQSVSVQFPKGELVARIRRLVDAEVECCAEPLEA